jgi:hypothetical protein
MESQPTTTRPWLDDIVVGLWYYFWTSLIVVLGVMFGREFVKPPPHITQDKKPELLECFARHDGQNYKWIVTLGYSYDPERRSLVAFFPAYPMLARVVLEATDCEPVLALLIVSHAFLAGCFVMFARYVRIRYPGDDKMRDYTLLAFGLFPTTMFFRMAYTESMFVFLCLLALYGMQRRWPLLLIALVIGVATATRPVGVALLPPFMMHLWRLRSSFPSFAVQAVCLLPAACGGLLAYMAYLDAAFGDPLCFAKTQEHWQMTAVREAPDKITSLLTLEPIWGVLHPSSPRYWAKNDYHQNPFFSLLLANPIIFLGAVALLILGIRRKWLTAEEALLSAGLLLIPYVTRGYEMSMASQGRFAAAAVPLISALSTSVLNTPRLLACPLQTAAGAMFLTYSILLVHSYYVY